MFSNTSLYWCCSLFLFVYVIGMHYASLPYVTLLSVFKCLSSLYPATPDKSGHVTLSKSVTTILALADFTEIILLNLVLLIILIKLGMLYCSKFRFVPFYINLNLLRKNNCNANGICSKSTLKLLMLYLLLSYFLVSNFHLLVLLWSYPSILRSILLPEWE